jgi:tRNA U55 pseudouridine synthase TruB
VALRRTGLEPFDGGAMIGLEQLQQAEPGAPRDGLLLPPGTALRGWPQLTVDEVLAHRLSRGQTLLMEAGPAGLTAVFDQRQRLLGIAESDGAGHLIPRRWMNHAENKPELG